MRVCVKVLLRAVSAIKSLKHGNMKQIGEKELLQIIIKKGFSEVIPFNLRPE